MSIGSGCCVLTAISIVFSLEEISEIEFLINSIVASTSTTFPSFPDVTIKLESSI